MKAEFNKRRFIISVLVLGMVGFGITFGDDVIVKEGSEYIANKLGIGTTSPTVALDVSDGEVVITGSDGVGGNTDAPDALVVTGGDGADHYYGCGKGSDISLTSGDGGELGGPVTPGAGGDITMLAGAGGGIQYYTGTCADGGDITITSGEGGSAMAGGVTLGNSGDIELTIGEPGSYGGSSGDYGNVLLAKNGGYVGIGTDSPSSELDVAGTVTMENLILPVKSTTGDPASPVEGQIYVNTYDNKVRVYADGAWRDLATW